jgi:hypothetical protein
VRREFLAVLTKWLSPMDAFLSEAHAALLTTTLAAALLTTTLAISAGCSFDQMILDGYMYHFSSSPTTLFCAIFILRV